MKNSVEKIRNITVIGLVLNVFLSSAKAVGGVIFHSQSLIADAVHSLSDLVTDIAVLVGVKYWNAPPDESHPYGYGRVEAVVSAAIGVILGAVAVELAWDAFDTVKSGKYTVPELPAFWIALFSIFSKELLYQVTGKIAKECSSTALAANAKHHRSDALSSIPVAAAIIISNIFPQIKYVDQAGAFIVSFFIMLSAWQIVKPALDELCDAGNCELQKQILEIASGYPQISAVHHIRTRRIGRNIVGEIHVRVEPDITVREGYIIARQLETEILSANGRISDMSILVEPAED